MERREVRVGREVAIRPAGAHRTLARKHGKVVGIEDRPGYRQHRALVRMHDSGEIVTLRLARLESVKRG